MNLGETIRNNRGRLSTEMIFDGTAKFTAPLTCTLGVLSLPQLGKLVKNFLRFSQTRSADGHFTSSILLFLQMKRGSLDQDLVRTPPLPHAVTPCRSAKARSQSPPAAPSCDYN